jgi:hypothetical protein
MLFHKTTFIGMDPTAGKRPFVYAALDHELRLLALGQGHIDSVVAFAGGQQRAFAAICSPSQPNTGLMQKTKFRDSLNPVPNPGRWMNCRCAEYLLHQHNIRIPQTPSSRRDCAGWMRAGFQLFKGLQDVGYSYYPDEVSDCQVLEVYPHASYTVLLGVKPFQKKTLEGKLQRQILLKELKIDIPDPMDFFEEITRYKLRNGILPDDILHTPEELDALIAAYTAWKTVMQPEAVIRIGDAGEGQVVLPVSELRSRY